MVSLCFCERDETMLGVSFSFCRMMQGCCGQ